MRELLAARHVPRREYRHVTTEPKRQTVGIAAVVQVRRGSEETGAVVEPGAHRLQRKRVGAHHRVHRLDVLRVYVPADLLGESVCDVLVASALGGVGGLPRRVFTRPLPRSRPGRAQLCSKFQELVREQPLVRYPVPGHLRPSPPRLALPTRAAPVQAEQPWRGASIAPDVVGAPVEVLADDGAHGRDLNLRRRSRGRALASSGGPASRVAERAGEGVGCDGLARFDRGHRRFKDDNLAPSDGAGGHHPPIPSVPHRGARVAPRAEVEVGEVRDLCRRGVVVGPGRGGLGADRLDLGFRLDLDGVFDDGHGDPQLPAALAPLRADALRSRACVEREEGGTWFGSFGSAGSSRRVSGRVRFRKGLFVFPRDRFVSGRFRRAHRRGGAVHVDQTERIGGTYRVEARTVAPLHRRPPWTAPASATSHRTCRPLTPRGITLRDPPRLSPPTDWPRPRSPAAGPGLCLWCGDKRRGRRSPWPPRASISTSRASATRSRDLIMADDCTGARGNNTAVQGHVQ